MRIIAGEFRSRKIESLPGDTTRPTLDKVKEALFNRIGPFFNEESMLDVFGGSGNIAFEFLSRGIKKATIIERDNKASQVITNNIRSLDLEDRVKLMKMDSFKAVKQLNQTFDYIYLDPPYEFNKIEKMMSLLKPHVKPSTKILYECDSKKNITKIDGYQIVRNDVYGHTRIIIFECEKEKQSCES